MAELSAFTLAWVAASLAVAGLVKGIAGIGIPLVGVSLLSLVLSVPQAVALLPVPIIIANAWQAIAGGLFVQTCRRYALLILAMGAGTFAGGALLAYVREDVLLILLGLVILAFAGAEITRFRVRVPPHHQRLAGTAAGLVGGLLGGMSGVFGPPVIMFLASLGLRKEEFVATISTIYLATGFLLGAMLAGYGVAGGAELLWSALATLPLFAGLAVGQFTRRLVSESLFRKVLMALLVLIGLNLLRKGLAGGIAA